MIPVATTTIAVLEVPADAPEEGDDYRDPYDPQPAAVAIATGVRAHISSPGGSEQVAGASQEVVEFRMGCDPTALKNTHIVLDETTGVTYSVSWVMHRYGLELDHVEAGLRTVTGVV